MPNIEALKQLRRVVEEAPDDRWDMTTLKSEKPGVGIVRCFLGWASIDPWHRENTNISEVIESYWVWPDPVGGEGVDTEKLGQIYGIDYRATWALFWAPDQSTNVPRSAIIANIDRLIAGEPAIPY